MFGVGKFLIGLYLRSSSIASTYGAAGGLIALLLWIYYSAQLFLFGAEFTKAYALREGSQQDSPELASGMEQDGPASPPARVAVQSLRLH
jgi:membrane protein